MSGASIRPLRYDYLPLESVRFSKADEALVDEASRRGGQRIFLLASRSLNRQTDAVTRIARALGSRLAGIFDGVRGHTPRDDVFAALAAARKARADLLIAVGGGSVIDAAKMLQFALNESIDDEESLRQYARFSNGSRGSKAGLISPSTASRTRFIAVPTTLSGAEFSNTANLLDLATGDKEGYRAPDLCAQVVIYDPALALHTPDWLWFSTAIRALDHAVEGYCANDVHPFLEAHFLHAMGLFAHTLRVAKAQPNDLDARAGNQQAAWLACAGLGRVSHGASHGIGYSLSAVCGLAHGYSSCVLLPAVLRWNAAVNQARQADIARALQRPHASAADAVAELIGELGLPSRLREAGVARHQLAQVAARAAVHPVLRKNPRPIAGPEQVMEILELAW